MPSAFKVVASASSLSRLIRSILLSARIASRPEVLQACDDCPRVGIDRFPRRIHQQHDKVGVGGALPRGGDHGALKPLLRGEDSGRIDEDDLAVALGRDAQYPRTGGLDTRRDDRHLLADDVVQQGRFAGIRRADQRHEPATRMFGHIHRFWSRLLCGSGFFFGNLIVVRSGSLVTH